MGSELYRHVFGMLSSAIYLNIYMACVFNGNANGIRYFSDYFITYILLVYILRIFRSLSYSCPIGPKFETVLCYALKVDSSWPAILVLMYRKSTLNRPNGNSQAILEI